MPLTLITPKINTRCENCNNPIIAKTIRRRFCNGHCAYKKRYVYKGRLKGKFMSCFYCGRDVWVRPWRIKKNKMIFCSKQHSIMWQKENAFNFPCKNCGLPIYTSPGQLKLRARSTCSKICRREYARNLAEERRKKLGYTKHQLDRLARYSIEAKEWRISVFARDNWTCQICNKRGGYLEADHIKPFSYFPELRYEIPNGRTLCRPCHDKTKISYKKMRMLYKDKIAELKEKLEGLPKIE